MASFQAKIVWKRPRKRGNKNYSFVPFLPDAFQKIPKKKAKKKKNKKNKKHHCGIISSQNCLENAKTVRNKNYRFVPSLPDA